MTDPTSQLPVFSTLLDGILNIKKLKASQSLSKSDKHLQTVIGETIKQITNTCHVLIETLGELLSISLEKNSDISEAKKLLFEYKHNWLRPEIIRLKSYTDMLTELNQDYLSKKGRGKEKNRSALIAHFTNLRNLTLTLDKSFFELEAFVSDFSEEVFQLLQENKLAEAKSKLNEFKTISLKVEDIRKNLENLSALEKEFIIGIEDGFEVVDFHKMKKNKKYSFNFEGSEYEFRKDDKGNLLVTEVG